MCEIYIYIYTYTHKLCLSACVRIHGRRYTDIYEKKMAHLENSALPTCLCQVGGAEACAGARLGFSLLLLSVMFLFRTCVIIDLLIAIVCSNIFLELILW